MTTTENPARAQAAANTRKLIEWAVEAVRKPLPEPVRRRAAIILSDDIGASGKIAQFAKEPDVPERLAGLTDAEQFLALLEEKGV